MTTTNNPTIVLIPDARPSFAYQAWWVRQLIYAHPWPEQEVLDPLLDMHQSYYLKAHGF